MKACQQPKAQPISQKHQLAAIESEYQVNFKKAIRAINSLSGQADKLTQSISDMVKNHEEQLRQCQLTQRQLLLKFKLAVQASVKQRSSTKNKCIQLLENKLQLAGKKVLDMLQIEQKELAQYERTIRQKLPLVYDQLEEEAKLRESQDSQLANKLNEIARQLQKEIRALAKEDRETERSLVLLGQKAEQGLSKQYSERRAIHSKLESLVKQVSLKIECSFT